MYKSKKDFNEIKVFVNFKAKYVHPRELANQLRCILEVIYENHQDMKYCDFKNINFDILKYALEKIEKYFNDLNRTENILLNNKEMFDQLYNRSVEPEEIITSLFVLPQSSIELTVSELIMVYRCLEFCKSHISIMNQFMRLGDTVQTINTINQIQLDLQERLTYALCISNNE